MNRVQKLSETATPRRSGVSSGVTLQARLGVCGQSSSFLAIRPSKPTPSQAPTAPKKLPMSAKSLTRGCGVHESEPPKQKP